MSGACHESPFRNHQHTPVGYGVGATMTVSITGPGMVNLRFQGCSRWGCGGRTEVMTDHFRALDGWRGIAALSVALLHFSPWPMWGEGRDVWALFVPFFFIL